MVALGCGPDRTAPEEDFHHFRRRNAGAELAGHNGGRSLVISQINGGRISEVVHLQASRSQPHKEPQRFFSLSAVIETKIIIKTHASRQKIKHCGTHAQRSSRNGGDVFCSACGEDLLAGLESKKIQAVQIDIDTFQKIIQIVRSDTIGEPPDFKLGIDIPGLPDHDLKLPLTQAADRRACLAVTVGKIESIEIRQMKFAYAQPAECQQMNSTHAPEPSYGYPFLAQLSLLPPRQPTDISGKGFLVIKWYHAIESENFYRTSFP